MTFNDGMALSAGERIGKGVVLVPEGTAQSIGIRPAMTLPANGLSDFFQPLRGGRIHVENNEVLDRLTLISGSTMVQDGTIRPKTLQTENSRTTGAEAFCGTGVMSVVVSATAVQTTWPIQSLYPFLFHVWREGKSVADQPTPFVQQRTGMALSFDPKKKRYVENSFAQVSAIAVQNDDHLHIQSADAFAADIRIQKASAPAVITPAQAFAEDYRPPNWGQAAGGSGLSASRVTAQKNAFFELYLKFDDAQVKDVLGLPDGLVMENSYIKGTPLVSGKYPATVKLTNDRAIDMLIIIPDVPRQL